MCESERLSNDHLHLSYELQAVACSLCTRRLFRFQVGGPPRSVLAGSLHPLAIGVWRSHSPSLIDHGLRSLSSA